MCSNASELSYMYLDDMMATNLHVSTITPSRRGNCDNYSMIDLANEGVLGIRFRDHATGADISNLSFTPSDGLMTMATAENGVRILTCNNNFYSLSSNNSSLLHDTNASGHGFTNAGSGGRLNIRNGFDGVSICSRDSGSLPANLTFSATEVRCDSDFYVGNSLCVGNTVTIGSAQSGVTLFGPTIMADGLHINSGAFCVSDLFSANGNCVSVNCPNEHGTPFKVGGNTSVTGSLLVYHDAVVDGNLSALGVTAGTANINALMADMLNVNNARIASLYVNHIDIADSTAVTFSCGDATVAGDLRVSGNVYCADVFGADATFSGVTANVASVNALLANVANVHAVDAAVISIGGPATPGFAATVHGNAAFDSVAVGGDVTAAHLGVGGPAVAGTAATVHGSERVTTDLTVDGSIYATSIVAQGDAISFTANTLYFNTEQLYFKSNSYVVDAAVTTYTDKVVCLGNVSSTDAGRDGSGIQLLGVPDNLPAGLTGSMGLTWQARGGMFDANANVVPVSTRSRWELSGGNLSIKSVDEKYSYMFSIDRGELNIWKITMHAGVITATQKVATFGRI